MPIDRIPGELLRGAKGPGVQVVMRDKDRRVIEGASAIPVVVDGVSLIDSTARDGGGAKVHSVADHVGVAVGGEMADVVEDDGPAVAVGEPADVVVDEPVVVVGVGASVIDH